MVFLIWLFVIWVLLKKKNCEFVILICLKPFGKVISLFVMIYRCDLLSVMILGKLGRERN